MSRYRDTSDPERSRSRARSRSRSRSPSPPFPLPRRRSSGFSAGVPRTRRPDIPETRGYYEIPSRVPPAFRDDYAYPPVYEAAGPRNHRLRARVSSPMAYESRARFRSLERQTDRREKEIEWERMKRELEQVKREYEERERCNAESRLRELAELAEPAGRPYFSFSLPRASPAASTTGSMLTAEEDSNLYGEKAASPLNRTARVITTSYVLESEYTGKGPRGDPQTATVTVMNGAHAHARPLFRWIHFTSPSMDFDAFADEVSRVPNLTSSEKRSLSILMNDVKLKYVKPIQISDSKTVRLMEPDIIQATIPSPTGSTKDPSTRLRTVTWVCLPYFSLEKYSGLESDASFPIQTLLQAQFSRSGRARDMQQAVCKNKLAPPGYCFHIAQIWCVVLDNSFLFTCSRLPESALYGQSIQRIVKTPEEISDIKGKGHILDFTAHFRELFPTPLIFHHQKNQVVTAKEWPAIRQRATRGSIILKLTKGSLPKPPPVGVLPPGPYTEDESESGESEPSLPPETKDKDDAQTQPHPTPTPSRPAPPRKEVGFSIFSCLEGVWNSKAGTINRPNLTQHMVKVGDYLMTGTTFSDRKAYRRCHGSSYANVHRKLALRGAKLSADPADASSVEQTEYEEHIDVVSAAAVIFDAFFPTHHGIPTTGRFWGAIDRLIDPSDHPFGSRDRPSLRDLRVQLRGMCITLTSFTDLFKMATPKDLSRIVVPDELIQAWIHLLMSVIYLPTDRYRSERLFSDAEALLDDGLRIIVMSLSETDLIGESVVLPMELLSLVCLELIKSSNPGLPNIADTYSHYLSTLEAEISSNPSDRAYERRLAMLKQETTIIRNTLSTQYEIMGNLDKLDFVGHLPHLPGPGHTRAHRFEPRLIQPASRHYEPGRPRYAAGPTADPFFSNAVLSDIGGFRESFRRECISQSLWTNRMISETHNQATDLEEFCRNQIDTTKDRQERAIYAFTIVTVIFLPLSSVASIFGMNTVDVRDMPQSQWIYWAVAVPVTVVVIFLGLLWTGELTNIVRWFASLGSDEKGAYYEVKYPRSSRHRTRVRIESPNGYLRA